MTMNSTTFDVRYSPATTTTSSAGETNKTGFFARMLQRFIAAREAEARRRIAVHFCNVSDRQLVGMGMSARDIELIRSGQGVRIDLAG
jgi:hypothetical protein